MSASKPSERAAIVGVIDPQTVVNSEVFTDVVDMSKFQQALVLCFLGNMASETIDLTLYYCDSDGNNAVELKAATQLSASASANDNKQLAINLDAQELAALNKRYVKAGLVTGNSSGGPACVVILGMQPRFGPANDNDLASVAEIVA